MVVGCGDGEDPAPAASPDAAVDAASGDADPADVAGEPVTGSFINTRFGTTGKTPAPVDLSKRKIGIWTGDDLSRYLAGSGSTDGTFVVPGVPPGAFQLALEYNGFQTILASDGTVRTFDLGYDFVRNAANETAPAGPNTIINVVVNNAAPWDVNDQVDVMTNTGFKLVQ